MRFAFSPPPVEDELLSSWVHRVAMGTPSARGNSSTSLAATSTGAHLGNSCFGWLVAQINRSEDLQP